MKSNARSIALTSAVKIDESSGICCILLWLSDITAQPTFDLFVFVALRPMSTAMVIAGRSVHLTTLFPGQA